MDNRRTVLLADANEEFRGLLRETIEKTEGFTVVGSTGDGAEALQLMDRYRPALAVLDVVLPGLDGFALLRQLKARGDMPKVIMVSAFCTDQVVGEAMALGRVTSYPSPARRRRCWTGCGAPLSSPLPRSSTPPC